MMFPKVKKDNKKVIKELRSEHDCCERCGNMNNLEVAHVISRGAGGIDMRENLIVLCGKASMSQGCHGANHRGEIKANELFKIIARREGVTAETCRKRVRRAMGYKV